MALFGASQPATKIYDILGRYMSYTIAETMIRQACRRMSVSADTVTIRDLPRLCNELQRSVRLFVGSPREMSQCIAEMQACAHGEVAPELQTPDRVVIAVANESDALTARSMAREYAARIGFRTSMQIRIATVVSELVRNLVQYAGCGSVTLAGTPPAIEIEAVDAGTGIPNLDEIMQGRYVSRTGMGLGLLGAKRLMDEFDVQTDSTGTRVRVVKYKDSACASS